MTWQIIYLIIGLLFGYSIGRANGRKREHGFTEMEKDFRCPVTGKLTDSRQWDMPDVE